MEGRMIKLPQIESRKKSYESHVFANDAYRVGSKVAPSKLNLKQGSSQIAKKKPSSIGVNPNSHAIQQHHYHSMIQGQSATNAAAITIAQNLQSSTQVVNMGGVSTLM